MAKHPRLPTEQDASMKAHKAQLFEVDETVGSTEPGKPFRRYLGETPAAPLPMWMKASLWAAGVVVGLLLILALLRMNRPRKPPAPAADRGRPVAAVLRV